MLFIALSLIVMADAYFVVTTLVDLYPLNNVRNATHRERVSEVAVNAPLMAVPVALLALAAALGVPPLGYIGASIELLIAFGGLVLWWLPYLAGRSVPWATAGTEGGWSELHARTYAHTIIVLPRIGGRPRPNLEHMILHLLLLAGAASAFAASASL